MTTTDGYTALRERAAWIDLSSRARIAVRGRDAARFLHNITSNDVKRLAPGEGCYAFLLNPQGRIQADMFLLSFPEHYLIGAEPELREKVQQHMRRYIIADQVELEDITANTAEFAIEGPDVQSALEFFGAPLPQADFSHTKWGEITVVKTSLTGQPGYRLITPAQIQEELIRKLDSAGVSHASGEEARTVRIENGKPRYGEDIDDHSLPQETDQMHGVSFNKGCYLGQEIVERIRARGHVNRILELIELPGSDPVAPGTVIEVAGKQAQITSWVFSPRLRKAIALAYVRQ